MSETAFIDCLLVCDTAVGVRRCALRLPSGSTVADAIAAAGRELLDAATDWEGAVAGIWGRRCDRGTVLRSGDRVELYRVLVCDPKVSRRARARARGTPRQR